MVTLLPTFDGGSSNFKLLGDVGDLDALGKQEPTLLAWV